jgi:hypothetical protein
VTVVPQKSRSPKLFTAHSRPAFQSCNLGPKKLAFSTIRDSLSVLSGSFCLSSSTLSSELLREGRAYSCWRLCGTEALDASDIALTDLERKISSGIAGIVPFKSVLRLGPSPSWQSQIGVYSLAEAKHVTYLKSSGCDLSRGGTFSR